MLRPLTVGSVLVLTCGCAFGTSLAVRPLSPPAAAGPAASLALLRADCHSGWDVTLRTATPGCLLSLHLRLSLALGLCHPHIDSKILAAFLIADVFKGDEGYNHASFLYS